jgi:hypothetical protein
LSGGLFNGLPLYSARVEILRLSEEFYLMAALRERRIELRLRNRRELAPLRHALTIHAKIV